MTSIIFAAIIQADETVMMARHWLYKLMLACAITRDTSFSGHLTVNGTDEMSRYQQLNT